MGLGVAIQQLHDRCAIYTSASTASLLLDLIGWASDADLSECVLLEPCVGEGAILLEGARRLIASLRSNGRDLGKKALIPRIKGFEFHPGAARAARIALQGLLAEVGLDHELACEVAESWILARDFLLEQPLRATHVAANPPYVRWAKLPSMLAKAYREALPTAATRGDLSVAFLDRMLEWASHGAIAALVSDRWMYAQYGQEFVRETGARGWSIQVAEERPSDPFVRSVGAYSAIVILTKTQPAASFGGSNSRVAARSLHSKLVVRYGSLQDAACDVRVGPALGAGGTFIVEPDEPIEVERELLRPFVGKQDLKEGEVTAPPLRVVIPYDRQGKLIDPACWPDFSRWAAARRETLSNRSQFRNAEQYWRTIDAVPIAWSRSPKLLLPELCRKPTVAIDHTGSIPAHSIYAIWSDEWPIDILQRVLNSGLLELTAGAEAPRLKMGWVRFYKRFLMRTPLPRWSSLSPGDQVGLAGAAFDEVFERLFDFGPGAPPGS